MNQHEEPGISICLSRTYNGLGVTINVSRAVEEFFKVASGPEVTTTPVGVIGRAWQSVNTGTGEILEVYNLTTPELAKILGRDVGIAYRLDRVGVPLAERSADAGADAQGLPVYVVNLGFLRLVGASRPEGVTFRIDQVSSEAATRRLHDQITAAAAHFWRTFIRPVVLTSRIVPSVGAEANQ